MDVDCLSSINETVKIYFLEEFDYTGTPIWLMIRYNLRL
jgi:hypothetical protein